jgi:flagellar hook assembly protein FlgD
MPYVRALARNDSNLFAGTWGGGVWRWPLSQIATSVEASSTESAVGFRLMQNYPNPFNPSTTIGFSNPKRAHVRIEILNVLGQVLETLVDKTEEAGVWSVRWNAENSPSGLYFYRIDETDQSHPITTFAEVRKMVYLK